MDTLGRAQNFSPISWKLKKLAFKKFLIPEKPTNFVNLIFYKKLMCDPNGLKFCIWLGNGHLGLYTKNQLNILKNK
jgi:hypothetical protein